MRIKILGQYYKLRFINNLGPYMGQVDTPESKNKELHIKKNLEPFEELDTTLHELNHILYPQADEAFIEKASTDEAKVLWKLGYRKLNAEELKEFNQKNSDKA